MGPPQGKTDPRVGPVRLPHIQKRSSFSFLSVVASCNPGAVDWSGQGLYLDGDVTGRDLYQDGPGLVNSLIPQNILMKRFL